MHNGIVQVQVTDDDREELEAILERLVATRLVAVGQMIAPVSSMYWWQGRVERADEWLAVVRTHSRRLDDVIDAIREMHHYVTPSITVLPIVDGHAPYLKWIEAEASPAED